MDSPSRLENLPISFFAMVMGLAGFTIAWEKTQRVFELPLALDRVLMPMAGGVFLILLILYLLKLFRHFDAVRAELHNPVKLNFFPTISISLILLSICSLHLSHTLSGWLWLVGTVLHLVFTFYVMDVWIHHDKFEVHHINPAWFIPVVGNVLVPITGVSLGQVELSWFFFSIGILFWLVLFAIIFYRVLFHNPLPGKLMPTFFILIAPPAVGFIAYMKLSGGLDAFGRILYYSGLFLTLLLLTQVIRFSRLKFFLSWWAYSFPLAAITVATLVMYQQTGLSVFAGLGLLFLGLLTLIVLFLLYKTLLAITRHQICQPEG